MKTSTMRDTVIWIYDNVHAGLWAALLSFVFYIAVVVAPKMPEARARYEAQRTHTIAVEHDFYCAKFGMGHGTAAHAQCILDLQAFRAKVAQRMAEEADF